VRADRTAAGVPRRPRAPRPGRVGRLSAAALALAALLPAGGAGAHEPGAGAMVYQPHGGYITTGTAAEVDGVDYRFSLGRDLFRGWFYLWGDADLLVLHDAAGRAHGFGLVCRAQLYAYRGAGFAASIDAGLGGYAFDRAFPPGGTIANLSKQAGASAEVALRPGLEVVVGYRWVHISNQNALGAARNPAFDGNSAYLGLRIH
jgi:Lipid A 3-O-deacylase (PagL)